MCAGSNAKIGETEIQVYMGYYGGNIQVGTLEYDVDKKKATRNELIECLNGFKKEELSVLIADLIDNSDEQ